MPEYSKLAQERDVFGELGWLPNFEVKNSKNNAERHLHYREMFDRPQDYTREFHSAAQTNTEFFRSNAPIESVACKTFGSTQSASKFSQSGSQVDRRRSYNPVERLTFSAGRRSAKVANSNPFVLVAEKTNKHRVSSIVHSTVLIEN